MTLPVQPSLISVVVKFLYYDRKLSDVENINWTGFSLYPDQFISKNSFLNFGKFFTLKNNWTQKHFFFCEKRKTSLQSMYFIKPKLRPNEINNAANSDSPAELSFLEISRKFLFFLCSFTLGNCRNSNCVNFSSLAILTNIFDNQHMSIKIF